VIPSRSRDLVSLPWFGDNRPFTARKPWVAVALSVAIPGLGHVYAGTFGTAIMFGVFDRFTPAVLDVLAGAGALGVKALAASKLVFPLVVRLSAAVAAIAASRRAEPQAPPGAYAFYVVAWFVAAFLLGQLTGAFVSAVPLTQGGHGLKVQDRVLTTRLGDAQEPREGTLAVWFEDWPDAGQSPLVPSLRQVRVGRVTRAGSDAFEVDGRSVPRADYGGVPLGVLSAPSPDGRSLDWSRVGIVPSD
jgi:hypothetical protein